jgi:hypothetical protein
MQHNKICIGIACNQGIWISFFLHLADLTQQANFKQDINEFIGHERKFEAHNE